MKNTLSAIMTGCLILLLGTMSFAADAGQNKELPTEAQQAVDQDKVIRQQKLRAWVDSIKPAAGFDGSEIHQTNEYWKQSVRRENRGTINDR